MANFKIDMEKELEILYNIFTPVIIDCDYIYSGEDEIYAYFDKYNFLSNTEKSCAISVIKNQFDIKKGGMEYRSKLRSTAIHSALDKYSSQINQPNKGLGFDIITNNVADAAAYTAMGALSEARQNMSKTISANKSLTEALQKINSDYPMLDNKMLESEVEKFTYAFRKALENVKTFYSRKQFFKVHNDFYVNKTRYDNGSKIDGANVYDILALICADKTIATDLEKLRLCYRSYSGSYSSSIISLADKFIAQGYIEKYRERNPECHTRVKD